MSSSTRCLFLTGAPLANELDWSAANFRSGFQIAFDRFLGQNRHRPGNFSRSNDFVCQTPPSKWRSLGFLQVPKEISNMAPPEFLLFGKRQKEEVDVQTDFFEDSIAMLDNLEPLQLASSLGDNESVMNGNLGRIFPSLPTSIDSHLSNSTEPSPSTTDLSWSYSNSPLTKPLFGATINDAQSIYDVQDVPSAHHVNSICPQTITVTLLVGVISVSAARTVLLPKQRIEMEVIEVVVGDETRAGLSISFWIAPQDSKHKADDDLRASVSKVRRGDTVLLRNIALSTFRNCVHGQSLSKRFAKNTSAIVPLRKDNLSSMTTILREKFHRVEQWSSNFVGVARDERPSKSRTSKQPKQRVLPPDTQESW